MPARLCLTALGLAGLAAPAAAQAGADLTVIYSNFSDDRDNLYFCCNGLAFAQRHLWPSYTSGVAMPFTPATNATIQRVHLALSNSSGENRAIVSLNADAGGVPGAVLRKFNVSGLPKFGGCCATVTLASSANGVPVAAGTQYWVVAFASKNMAGTWNTWNVNSIGLPYAPFAVFQTGAWSQRTAEPAAFAVLGTPEALD